MAEHIFKVVNGTLVPDDDFARADILRCKEGQRITCEVRHRRNPEQLKAYWCTLRDAAAALSDQFSVFTPEDLHDWLKRKMGLVDMITLPDGSQIERLRSVAIGSMSQAEWQPYFVKVRHYLNGLALGRVA